MYYDVAYQAADYKGVRRVSAEDEDEAIMKVKAWVGREMVLAMYYESYRIVGYIEDNGNYIKR